MCRNAHIDAFLHRWQSCCGTTCVMVKSWTRWLDSTCRDGHTTIDGILSKTEDGTLKLASLGHKILGNFDGNYIYIQYSYIMEYMVMYDHIWFSKAVKERCFSPNVLLVTCQATGKGSQYCWWGCSRGTGHSIANKNMWGQYEVLWSTDGFGGSLKQDLVCFSDKKFLFWDIHVGCLSKPLHTNPWTDQIFGLPGQPTWT